MKVTVEIIVERKRVRKNEEEMDWQIRECQGNISGVNKEVVEDLLLGCVGQIQLPIHIVGSEKNNCSRTYLSHKVVVF